MVETKAPYHHGNLDRVLVALAMKHLEMNPPASLSLRELAREAGVSANAPYRHFRDREELLSAVVREAFQQLTQRFVEASEASTEPALFALGDAYVAFAIQRPWLFRLMFSGCDLNKPKPSDDSAFALLVQAIKDLTGESTTSEDLQRIATACWCMAHGIATLAIEGVLGMIEAPTTTRPYFEALRSIGWSTQSGNEGGS